MLIRMDDWQRIREHFSEEEKATINAAISGEVICPRGCVIDETKAGEVVEKAKRLINGLGIGEYARELKRGGGRLKL